MSNEAHQRMSLRDALEVLLDLRTQRQIVVTNQASSRLWPRLSGHPLDFNYNPSTMGGAIPLGLGLALAQKQREVLVISGDGSLLMSLGCLVTVVDSGATNLSIVLIDNGVYEVTGGQKTPATASHPDLGGLARCCGFPNVAHLCDIHDFRARAKGIFKQGGPRFVWLSVEPVREDFSLAAPGPLAERLERFRQALSQ